MINFDSLILKIFAQENNEYFIGAKVQKVQQPSRNELIFLMRNKGESKKFYINFNPNFYHLCFMNNDSEKIRNFVIPKQAPMFCMLLRKYIQNAKIIKIEVPKNERIFEIYFEYFDELNEKTILCLAIELMGKHSNVILYNYDTNVIVGCAHNVSSEKSRERELYGMLPYIYPPKQKKKDLTRVTFESFNTDVSEENIIQDIVKKYNYLTTPSTTQIIESYNLKSKLEIYEKLKEFLSHKTYHYWIKNDCSQYSLIELKDSFKLATINELIDKYFSYHQQLSLIENTKNKILRITQNQIKKLNQLKKNQQDQIDKIEKALVYKQKADILMANLYYLKQGSKTVDLYDFEGNEITIDLDENLSPSDNANRYYNLYKKSKTAKEHAEIMLKETLSQILYFEEISFYAKNSNNIDELKELIAEINQEKEQIKEENQKIDFIEYQGAKIYIGKNKKQNDYILSKLSSAEDLWFHPLNFAGAHVLVKTEKNKEEVSDEILLKAAQLTKEFSSQKDNSKTCIIYTKRKYVKKANNKLAFVTYKNETEIVV